MRFLKRFLSIGSRKSKKRAPVDSRTESFPSPPVQEHPKVDDSEIAVCRLLRSSSGRIAPEPQTGLSSLPPLPHPIDSVIPRSKSSSMSIPSVSARSTYSVTIHSRTVHSRTEFPNAYPPMDFTPKRSLSDSPRRRSKSVPITPRDKSRLWLLRQDPSVASILNHYDDQGHLNSAIFSNTPSPRKEGGVQRHPTGSTLRQLLGHPSFPDLRNTGTESDISWAERYLGETDARSSVSSIGPQTPVDPHFTYTRSVDNETTLSIECDTSTTDQPTFSSLEVELSASADLAYTQAPDSPHGKPTTPQRASQIFGFLGDKKRVQLHDGPVSRLPQLKTTTPNYRHSSTESSISDTKPSHIPIPLHSSAITQPTSPINQRRFSLASDTGSHSSPTFSPAVISRYRGQSDHGPHGPCSPSKIPLRQSTGSLLVPSAVDDSNPAMEHLQYAVGERSNTGDMLYVNVTAALSREMHSQIPKLRTASGSSSSSAESRRDPVIHSPHQHPLSLQPGVRAKPRSPVAELPMAATPHSKENDVLSRLPQPITPVRPFGLHSHHLRELPSPASSSELSPVAKQMMANLREQRMHARQRERQAGRLGSSQSRIRC